MKFNIKKLRITPGSTFEARSGQIPPGISALDMVDEGFYALTGLRLPLSCCATTLPTNGQALTWDATNKKLVFTALSGGGAGTNITLGTITSTVIPLVSSTGTGVNLPLGTSTLAGLLSPVQFNKLSFLTVTQAVDLDTLEANVGNLITLSGVSANATNLGTFTGTTITDNSTIKVALQALETAVEVATNKTDNYFQVNPTGVNTVANITPVPVTASKVQISINGLIEKTGITVNASGVVTVNSGLLGYSIDTTDTIEFQYLS